MVVRSSNKGIIPPYIIKGKRNIMLKTRTVTAADLVGGMNIVIPERPEMFLSIMDVAYSSIFATGMIVIETEIGSVYMDPSQEVLIEDESVDGVLIEDESVDGVVIDSGSIRFALQEDGDLYEMEPDTLNKIFALSDGEISDVIHENLNDDFWEARNALISDVIAGLVEKVEG